MLSKRTSYTGILLNLTCRAMAEALLILRFHLSFCGHGLCLLDDIVKLGNGLLGLDADHVDQWGHNLLGNQHTSTSTGRGRLLALRFA